MSNPSQTVDERPSSTTILARYLSTGDVAVGVDVADKRAALDYIARWVERQHGVSHERVFGFLWRREQIGSTALGGGVAIPHARVAGIAEPIVLVLRLLAPIDFGAQGNRLVGVLFVILVPDQAAEEHLQILSAASERLSDPGFMRALAASPDAAELHRVLRQWPNHVR